MVSEWPGDRVGEIKSKVSWRALLNSGGRSGDGRWAYLIANPESEVEAQVRELERDPPTGGADLYFVRGQRCRNSQSLFREWGSSLDFPDYFGHNWDAFHEILRELVERHPEHEHPSWGRERPDTGLILVLRSPELLRDEPERLQTLIEIMRTAAFGLARKEKDRPRLAEFRVLFQCEPEEVESLRERLIRAGLDL